MKKFISLILAVIILGGTMLINISAASAASEDIYLFEDFEYAPETYVMGENFCYGNGHQTDAPTGTYENRGFYWIGDRRSKEMPSMFSSAELETASGQDSSTGLKITSSVTHNERSQTDIQVFAKQPVDASEYNYLVVWCDFSDVEFRAAGFSLITSDGIYGGTDERDGQNDSFYYLADGESEWEELVLGSDNCFGKDEDCPIIEMKGYFAFDLTHFKARTKIYSTAKSGHTGAVPLDSIVGVSLYFDHPNDEAGVYTNVPFYMDNILFTKELNVSNIPVHTHTYTNSWGYRSSDGHALTCDGCGELGEITEHTSSGEATETEPEYCTDCGYVIVPQTSAEKEIEFRVDSGYIQWHYKGENEWINIIAVSELKGEKGDTGTAGAKGDKGDTGAAGTQGEKGDTGATGPQGEKGDKGDTGAMGPQGEKGEKGDKGDQGEAGASSGCSSTLSGAMVVLATISAIGIGLTRKKHSK